MIVQEKPEAFSLNENRHKDYHTSQYKSLIKGITVHLPRFEGWMKLWYVFVRLSR